jgi:hypothetical protein
MFMMPGIADVVSNVVQVGRGFEQLSVFRCQLVQGT